MGKPEDFDKTWAEYKKLLAPLTEKYNKFMQQQLDHRVEVFGGFQD
jgi:putative aldouronate transport system substrate-binding protein